MEKTFVFVRNSHALLGVALGGLIGLASPALAQDVPPARITVTQDTVVSTRVVSTEIVTPAQLPVSTANARKTPPVYTGGTSGGAIGGYYINGTTRADNRPLPGGPWPYR